MAKICDNQSVGELIFRDRHLLLIERRNYPQAFALPAGHLGGDTAEAGALRETNEEVGIALLPTENALIWRGEIQNPCKREGRSHHFWSVFRAASWNGEPKAGSAAKRYFFASSEVLQKLARRTEYFLGKYGIPYAKVDEITRAIFGEAQDPKTDIEWLHEMGLEPAWYYILKAQKII